MILRKLGSYQRKNNLAQALIELGKIERSIFMLEWIKDPQLRRRQLARSTKLAASLVCYFTYIQTKAFRFKIPPIEKPPNRND